MYKGKGTKKMYKMGVPLLILIVFHLCIICVRVCHHHLVEVPVHTHKKVKKNIYYYKRNVYVVIILTWYLVQNNLFNDNVFIHLGKFSCSLVLLCVVVVCFTIISLVVDVIYTNNFTLVF